MAKTSDLLFQIVIYPLMVILLFSCEPESDSCTDYDLKGIYSLQNFLSDTETLEKVNNSYIDKNKSQLDNAFDGAISVSNLKNIGFFKDRIHFKLNFESSSNGYFQDGKDSVSLMFNFCQCLNNVDRFKLIRFHKFLSLF